MQQPTSDSVPSGAVGRTVSLNDATHNQLMESFIVERSDLDLKNRELLLRGDEAHHVRVLRLRVGERLLAADLLGMCYECELAQFSDIKHEEPVAHCRILTVLPEYGEPKNHVILIQGAISAPARWEWLLEKATELGVAEIWPVRTDRTENVHLKPDRADRILRAAVKQTKRARLPVLKELSSLAEALSDAGTTGGSLVMLHEAAEDALALSEVPTGAPDLPRITLVIGPEGGFSEREVAMAMGEFGAVVASLGERRLRAETAAIAALAIAVKG